MKYYLLFITLVVLTLIGCSEEEQDNTVTLQGDSNNWQGELYVEQLSSEEHLNERAEATLTYLGDHADDVHTIKLTTYTNWQERGALERRIDGLSSEGDITNIYGNYGFWYVNDQGFETMIDIEWMEDDDEKRERIGFESIE
ncbi:hypothetical protein CR203_05015 [Salipaludibacillus neizhouensis]|uniref:Lipoprotein n=1 Tax=Salipaludibacillus neizhouensis TaxID=885475 RepID=A0A3A9K6J9_9BACI|nr:hypothetical protein [Salipaludibacillus neizhouensis]RKL67869.1 hypothetical protein CR203_05015 [Salipaludibacillus neizhouensis]